MKLYAAFSWCSFLVIFQLLLLASISSSQDDKNGADQPRKNKSEIVKGLLNYCIDSKYHKIEPGPEDRLHSQCSPWKDRSCCREPTTVRAHYEKMYNFDWDHCSHAKAMSHKCRQHFVQDLCFYECSPNVGPWAVKIDQKIRKERFMDVPLCATDCDNWFNDCIDDYTCTDNWARNFDWEDSTNKCPVGSSCKPFRNIFKNSQEFCEKVWEYSWKYTPNDQHCMRIWFNSSGGNPNDNVAKWKAEQLVSSSERNAQLLLSLLASVMLRMF